MPRSQKSLLSFTDKTTTKKEEKPSPKKGEILKKTTQEKKNSRTKQPPEKIEKPAKPPITKQVSEVKVSSKPIVPEKQAVKKKEEKKPEKKGTSKKKTPVSVDDIIKSNLKIIEATPDLTPVGFAPPSPPEEFNHCLLLNVEYDRDTNKALMRFYDPESRKILFIPDPVGHKPYCISRYSKEELEKSGKLQEIKDVDGFEGIEIVQKTDLLENKTRDFLKLIGKTPLTIASGNSCFKNVLPDVLEANIRYHLNYIADEQLVPGLYYSLKNGKLLLDKIDLSKDVNDDIDKLMENEEPEYKAFFKEYLELFIPPVPEFPRVAIDLEIYQENEFRFPDPGAAKDPIIAISIVSTDGVNEVYLWKKHKFFDIGKIHDDLPKNIVIRVFSEEQQMVRELFRQMWRYPFVVTFNGDEFDLRYLYNRAKKLKIPDDENPIRLERGIGISGFSAFLKYGMHVDLYQFFRNRSIQGYGFSGAYTEFSLDAISQALLGSEKFQHDESISELSFHNLVYYNWKDSFLTLELTRFKSNLAMSLIVLLMRINRLPMREIIRTWVSSWVKQLLIWEHRKRNYLVPNKEDIQAHSPPGKSLKGALVIDPKPGIYFDVVVMDFSSLYPSIIKEYNLSYETINCKCDDCEKISLTNTPYHKCTNKIGIMALVTGVIRDLRVLYFKPKAKSKDVSAEQRAFYNTLQSALKVLINASYGVYGSETFSLYCYPVADSTTAIGRYSIGQTAKKAQELGVDVIYGDSDSVFLKSPGDENIDQLKRWSEEHLRLDLDVEKSYRFLALSSRKKNYLGVYKNGGVDIKGLVGKKSNTAQFIRESFFEFTDIISSIKDVDDFTVKKEEIYNLVKKYWNKLNKGTLPLEAYEIKVSLKGKTVQNINATQEPKLRVQHVMAARDLIKKKKKEKFEAGEVFSYVKVKSGAKALEIADVNEIDRKKYKDLYKSTFEQVLDALGISFEEIIGIKKLDSYF
ncbi:MAG: DNA-directed DNA polymerase I [Candidatus Hodarchaeota archaeon]